MAPENVSCYYHPNRDAITKCEKCGKLICVECKMVIGETRYDDTGDNSYTYSKRQEFCKLCYYNKKIKIYSAEGNLFFYICLFIILIIISLISPIYMVFSIFLAVVCLIGTLTAPKKLSKNLAEKEKFLNSLDQSLKKTSISNKNNQYSKDDNTSDLTYCQQCGKRIDINATFCNLCNNSTVDERH